MSLEETPEEKRFREKARRFTEDFVMPLAERVEDGLYPRDILQELGKNSLLGAAFPKADGGLGLGWTFEALVAEELSVVSAATEMSRLASGTFYAAPLAYFGTKTQKRDFLKPVLRGDKVGSLCLTEPEAGSDAGSIKTRATKKADNYVLNGEKRFITNGGVADFLLVFANTNPSKAQSSGMSSFLVPRESSGLEVTRAYGLLGMHGANVAHLRFRNVKVPEENLVGRLNLGFPVLLKELDRERPVVAAGMLGIARSAFEAAVKYSAGRKQFARPIREFEAVSFKISDMAVQIEASRLLIRKAALLLDEGKDARVEGAIAKLFATEAAFEIANQSLQVHGGIGYTKDLPIERYFRDARFMMIGGGTSEIMRLLIQREIYKSPMRHL